MALIGSLLVNLKARTANFDKGMRRGRKGLAGFAKHIRSTTAAVAKMGIAAAVAGTAIAVMATKSAMKSLDAIGKMSDELQISTEALLGLGHAAQISGTDINTVQKALQIFVRRLGEAKQGLGEAVNGLKAMNLSADAMARLGTERAFLQIVDAIHKIPDASGKAYAAYTLFGRQGVNLLNMMQKGAAGITAMRKEFEKLAGTFSRVDIYAVEEANDALTRMKLVLTGLSYRLAISIAPSLKLLTDETTNWATSTDRVSNAFANLGNEIATAIAKAIDGFKELSWTLAATERKGKGFLEKTGLAAYGRIRLRIPISPITFFAEKIDPTWTLENLFKKTTGVDAPWKMVRNWLGEGPKDFLGDNTVAEMEDRFRKAFAKDSWQIKVQDWYEKLRAANKKYTSDVLASIAERRAAAAAALAAQIRQTQAVAREAAYLRGDQLAWAKQREGINKEIARYRGIQDFAKRVKEGLKGAVERFKDYRKELTAALKTGDITKAEFVEALRIRYKELTAPIEKAITGPGEFRVIKSALVDIRGLGMGKGIADPQIQKMDEQLKKDDKKIQLLTQIRDRPAGME